jgi:hypothetical protein
MHLKTRGAHVEPRASRIQYNFSSQPMASNTSAEMPCSLRLLANPMTEPKRLMVIMTLNRVYHSRKGRCNAFKNSMIHEVSL